MMNECSETENRGENFDDYDGIFRLEYEYRGPRVQTNDPVSAPCSRQRSNRR